MSLLSKLLWGLLAGIVIVLVKVVGPDKALIKSMFLQSNLSEMVFYGMIAATTACLGALSGLFSEETKPGKLLVFCASFPALVSTYTSMPSESIPAEAPATQATVSTPNQVSWSLIGAAYAQSIDDKFICKEAGFTSKLSGSAKRYWQRKSFSELPFHAVVVASTQNLGEAKSIAKRVLDRDASFAPFVGCRRPGNKFYPVIIGNLGTQAQSIELKGRFEEIKMFRTEPYLSYYEYRDSIFKPS